MDPAYALPVGLAAGGLARRCGDLATSASRGEVCGGSIGTVLLCVAPGDFGLATTSPVGELSCAPAKVVDRLWGHVEVGRACVLERDERVERVLPRRSSATRKQP